MIFLITYNLCFGVALYLWFEVNLNDHFLLPFKLECHFQMKNQNFLQVLNHFCSFKNCFTFSAELKFANTSGWFKASFPIEWYNFDRRKLSVCISLPFTHCRNTKRHFVQALREKIPKLVGLYHSSCKEKIV